MKIIFLLVLSLVSMHSNAWWIDTHAAFTEVTIQDLTPKTKQEINKLLNYPIAGPGPAVLSQETNNILNGSWSDLIKHTRWQSPSARLFYKSLHFMDIQGTVDEQLDASQARKRVQKFLLRDSMKMNTVIGIQSMMKTIKSSDSSTRERAIALRMLLSLIGDIHNPMHVLDLYFDNYSTNGQNTIHIDPVIVLQNFEGKSQKIAILHELWDASGGYVKDNGFQPIVQNSVYSNYLLSLAKEMILQQENNPAMIHRVRDPNIIHWAADAYLLGLEATEHKFIHYFVKSKGYVTGTIIHPHVYIAFVQKKCQQQLYLAGKHSALIFNALFDPEHAPKSYVEYLQKIEKNPRIKILNQMPPVR